MGGFLTATEFGAAVGRSEQTVWRWVREGILKPETVGSSSLFRKSDIERMRRVVKEKRRRTKSNPALATTQASDRKSAAAGGD